METRIYCPKCEWRPRAHDRWMCVLGCATIWNTFDTRGKCPGCSRQWAITACLACGVYSPHAHWYHDDVPDQADREHETYEREDELVGAGV